MALNMSLLQLLSPPALHGRVISVSLMAFGLMPLGVLPVSLAAEKVGMPTALAGSGILFVFIVGIFFVLNRRLRCLEV